VQRERIVGLNIGTAVFGVLLVMMWLPALCLFLPYPNALYARAYSFYLPSITVLGHDSMLVAAVLQSVSGTFAAWLPIHVAESTFMWLRSFSAKPRLFMVTDSRARERRFWKRTSQNEAERTPKAGPRCSLGVQPG
jgi:hypothetical protein